MALPKRILGAVKREFSQAATSASRPVRALKTKYNQAQATWKASPRYKKAQENFRTGKGRL